MLVVCFFFLGTLKMSFHCFQASIVGTVLRNHYNPYCCSFECKVSFYLVVLRFFFLSLVLSNLIIVFGAIVFIYVPCAVN